MAIKTSVSILLLCFLHPTDIFIIFYEDNVTIFEYSIYSYQYCVYCIILYAIYCNEQQDNVNVPAWNCGWIAIVLAATFDLFSWVPCAQGHWARVATVDGAAVESGLYLQKERQHTEQVWVYKMVSKRFIKCISKICHELKRRLNWLFSLAVFMYGISRISNLYYFWNRMLSRSVNI